MDYVKAAIGTFFLAQTLGVMCLVMIWGILSALHANGIIILTGESLGLLALAIICVPLYKLILKNERFQTDVPRVEEPTL